MEAVPQIYIDKLRQAHGNISATLDVLKNVESEQYIPLEDLMESLESMSGAVPAQYRDQVDGFIFASGKINKDVRHQKYTSMLAEGNHGLAKISDTQAAQFAERQEFKTHLARTLMATNSPLDINDALHGYQGQDGKRVPGIWDDISRKFAQNVHGHIITVTPRSSPDRVFVQSELPVLMDKILEGTEIETINGLPAELFADAYDALDSAGLTDEEIYETIDRVLIQCSSVAYLHGYAEDFAGDLRAVLNHEFGKTTSEPFKDLLENCLPELMDIRYNAIQVPASEQNPGSEHAAESMEVLHH